MHLWAESPQLYDPSDGDDQVDQMRILGIITAESTNESPERELDRFERRWRALFSPAVNVRRQVFEGLRAWASGQYHDGRGRASART